MTVLKLKAIALVIAFILMGTGAGRLGAEEGGPSAEFGVSALSAYIWRGQEMTRNSVVLQPSATFSCKGASVNLWGNMDTRPYRSDNSASPAYSPDAGPGSSTWTETDITLTYARPLGPLTIGAGYIYYGLNAPFAGAADPLDSQEIFVTAALNKFLNPSITAYKEIDHYHQWYFLVGVSHTFELAKSAGLKLAASASYLKSQDAAAYPRYDSSALPTPEKFNDFHDGVVSASLPLTVARGFLFTPVLSYVFPLSDDAKDEMKGRSRNLDRSSFFYGGAAVSFSF